MRAGIAKCERMIFAITSNDERNFEQRSFAELTAVNSIRRQRAIPKASKHQRVGGLALGKIEFGHGEVSSQISDCSMKAYASIRWVPDIDQMLLPQRAQRTPGESA